MWRNFVRILGGGNGSKGVSMLPKVLVFDLDGCVWSPEMYELMWGRGGAPFKLRSDGDLDDCDNEHIRLLGDVRNIMKELKTDPKWSDTLVGIASTCNEPNWAHECLDKFEIGSGVKLRSVFDKNLIEIHSGLKDGHLKAIQRQTGVSLRDMIFFDNQLDNCHVVSRLGVTVSYVPRGVTRSSFEHVLAKFPSPGDIVQDK